MHNAFTSSLRACLGHSDFKVLPEPLFPVTSIWRMDFHLDPLRVRLLFGASCGICQGLTEQENAIR